MPSTVVWSMRTPRSSLRTISPALVVRTPVENAVIASPRTVTPVASTSIPVSAPVERRPTHGDVPMTPEQPSIVRSARVTVGRSDGTGIVCPAPSAKWIVCLVPMSGCVQLACWIAARSVHWPPAVPQASTLRSASPASPESLTT